MSAATDFDVAVVGAGPGGCTAARLYAQEGLRVALVERRPDVDAHKTVCTHFIQSSAVGVLERLGLTPMLEEHGAVRRAIDLWTPYSGWIRPGADEPPSVNITRRTLDPLLRRLTADTPGVELMTGRTVVALAGDPARPGGVVLEERGQDRTTLRARLVVGADGRDSKVARMAGIRGRVRPHRRFFYWGYYRGVGGPADRSRMWLGEPDCAYTFPNEDGLTVVLTAPHRDRLPEYRADAEGAFRRDIEALPDGPDLAGAEREGKLLGKLDLPNVIRRAARPGLALVGDAALASDPLWGIGCGWAFQSAEWLVDGTAPALRGEGDLDRALHGYARRHRARLGPHHVMIADLASARRANPMERMLYRAAARDPHVARAFGKVGSRRHSPATVLRPATLARVALAGRPR